MMRVPALDLAASNVLPLRLMIGQSQQLGETVAASPEPRLLALDERQQVGIDRLRLCGWHAMWEVLIGLERPILQ